KLEFIVASRTGLEGVGGDIELFAPSTLVGATRSLFELGNNLLFTARAILRMRDRSDEIEIIYQRYSRFNFTGAVLSMLYGLPLVLEFNGSEVWVSRHWDPVGHLRLLSRFEEMNLNAADLISVVSSTQRLSLSSEGDAASESELSSNGER